MRDTHSESQTDRQTERGRQRHRQTETGESGQRPKDQWEGKNERYNDEETETDREWKR